MFPPDQPYWVILSHLNQMTLKVGESQKLIKTYIVCSNPDLSSCVAGILDDPTSTVSLFNQPHIPTYPTTSHFTCDGQWWLKILIFPGSPLGSPISITRTAALSLSGTVVFHQHCGSVLVVTEWSILCLYTCVFVDKLQYQPGTRAFSSFWDS